MASGGMLLLTMIDYHLAGHDPSPHSEIGMVLSQHQVPYTVSVGADETTNQLTVHFRILSRINALILKRTNDHAETSHAMDITRPLQTLSDIIRSFPIEITYKPTHRPILSHWIILSPTHYCQASGPRGVFKFY